MIIDFLPDKFPAGDATDGQYLYRTLGSFWTQIFKDKNALKGYTIGMAEELIQSYYNLMEVLREYSVKDIQPLHKEKWKSLIIRKSEFNSSPLVFEPNGAVFGFQPETDVFYANQLFRFGLPKQSAQAYSFKPPFNLSDFGLIANKVIAPSAVLLHGVDVFLQNGTLYFNSDLFNNEYIPKAPIANDLGETVTYTDPQGNSVVDEFIVLWIYCAQIDEASLYSNFGTLFDLKLTTSASYKEILKSLMNLSVEGPTIAALNSAYAALSNSPIVLEPVEVLEDIYNDELHQYVVTDKNVYRLPLAQPLSESLVVGSILHAGEILTNTVKLVDTVIDNYWWQRYIATPKLAFASHVFAMDLKNQLFFENASRFVKYSNSYINFPVLGRPEDVQAFHTYINSSQHREKLLTVFGFSNTKPGSVSINPLDFAFQHFFKNNVLLLKLEFYTDTQLNMFFDLLPLLKEYLPSHVYMLLYIQFKPAVDELANLNVGLTIPGFGGQLFSFDGSSLVSGARPTLPDTDPDYYKDYINRLFCVSVGPYRNPDDPTLAGVNDKPLHYNLDPESLSDVSASTNLDTLPIDNSGVKNSVAGIKCGLLRTEIPLSIVPPGESTPRTPSTKEIPAILLIDF